MRAWTFALALGCATAPASAPDAAMPDAWTACVTHTDCHVLEVGCCPCGDRELVAVNRAHAADVHRARSLACEGDRCDDASCPPAPAPSCVREQCLVRER